MKRAKLLIGLCAITPILGGFALLPTSCSCGGNVEPEPEPEEKTIPVEELDIDGDNVCHGLKKQWSEYGDYTTLLIPSNVVSVDNDAFASNRENGIMPKSIKTLIFAEPETNDESILVLNDNAFNGSKSLTKIVLPQRLNYVGEGCFADCTSVETLDLSTWTRERCIDGCNPFANVDTFKNWKETGQVITTDDIDAKELIYYMLNAGNNGIKEEWFGDDLELVHVAPTDEVPFSYDVLQNQSVVITGLQPKTVNIVIPEKLDVDKPVIGIAPFAFYESAIETISLQSNTQLFYIGASAFAHSKLQTATLCDNDGNTPLERIDAFAFGQCSELKSITISPHVATIGAWCFDGDSKLTEIKNLADSNITKIYPGTFEDCDLLNNSDILSMQSITWIGSYAFADSGLDGYLTKIVIKSPVTYIGEGAFWGQAKATSVDFPQNKSFAYIGPFAFTHCDSITSIYMPRYVSHIGAGAFACMEKLTNLDIHNYNNSYYSSDNAIYTRGIRTKLIASCNGSKFLVGWSSDVIEIGPYAFAGVTAGDIDLSDYKKLSVIGDYAFAYVKAATDSFHLILPDNISKIGNYAFYQSEIGNADFIYGIDNLTEWGDHMFDSCPKITDVNIDYGVEVIPKGTFLNSGLEKITIPNTVKTIGDFAFENCQLTQIDVSTFTSIPQWKQGEEKPFEIYLDQQCNVWYKSSTPKASWHDLFTDLGIVESENKKLEFMSKP